MISMKPSELIWKTFNPIKNGFQYLIGSVLYFLTFNSFYIPKFFLGLIGFVIAYHSVYQFNDLMDYEEDRKDILRKHYKPLVTGKTKRISLEAYTFLFLIIGLPLCFFVSTLFGALVVIILFLNFLHSSPFIRLKKSKFLIPNLFFIEFIKYSLGWFALTSSIINFPFFLITSLSFVYAIGYLYCKQNITNFLKNKKIKIMLILAFASYVISIFFYSFKLVMLLPVPITLFYLALRRFSKLEKIKIGINITLMLGVFFLISVLILFIPSVAELNNKICSEIDIVKENITEMIPEGIRCNLENIK